MEKLDKILADVLSKKGLTKTTQGAMVCFYAKEWGNDLFQPISFQKGILKVSVASSPAASEVHIKEAELVDFLNNKLSKQLVRTVRIVVKNNHNRNFKDLY